MRFWDSSAVVPLSVDGPSTRAVRSLLTADEAMVVWWATRVECVSALMRQSREGTVAPTGARRAREVLAVLARSWAEVQPSERVRGTAERLLAVHPLRAADALQLAAALEWCDGRPDGAELVSFDERLRGAAEREGFAAFPAH